MKQQRLYALDGARGAAAIGILLFHVLGNEISAFRHLHIAVDFFFVLSGFVLAPAVSRIHSFSGARVFIKSRYLRIFPMVLAVITFTVVYDIAVLVKHQLYDKPATPSIILSLPTLVTSLLLMQIFYEPSQLVDFPVWSLSAEWVANILLTGLSILTNKSKYVSLVIGAFMIGLSSSLGPPIFDQLGRAIWGFSVGLIAFEFQAVCIRKKGILIALIALLLPLYLLFNKIEGYYPFVFVWPLSALIIYLAQLNVPQRFLQPFSFMGKYSFGFYLWHFPMLSLSGYLLSTFGLENFLFGPTLNLLLVGSTLSILATKTSLIFFEEPIRNRWK